MLTHLSIRNVVLIERLDLTFGEGLTVITGETGAGKSILLDSLELGLGERAGSSMLYTGAKQGGVTVTFEIPPSHPVREFLKSVGLDLDPQEPVTFRRQILQEGRTRAYISDQTVTLSTMRQASRFLVEIQGQNTQVGLANPALHLPLLDQYGALASLAEETALYFQDWLQAQKDLDSARKAMLHAQKEEEWLRQTVEDLTQLNPQEGEELELGGLRTALQQNERRMESLSEALQDLRPRDRKAASASACIRAAIRSLERAISTPRASEREETHEMESATQNALQNVIASLERAEDAICEAENDLEALSFDLKADPVELEQTEERLFALRAEARKHGISCDMLPNYLLELQERLEMLDQGNERVFKFSEQVKIKREIFRKSAEKLSALRKEAALKLTDALHSEFPALKLENARFAVDFQPRSEDKWNNNGIEDVKFLVSTNPGHPMEILGKTASGGELSRLMLALRVVLAAKGSGTLLIFDEIDSGVGGATATAIGQRLKKIGRSMQTLAITHSPQVAAGADHHIRISKKLCNNLMTTFLEPLSDEGKREEVARMIAGESVTPIARQAAESLIAQSRAD